MTMHNHAALRQFCCVQQSISGLHSERTSRVRKLHAGHILDKLAGA